MEGANEVWPNRPCRDPELQKALEISEREALERRMRERDALNAQAQASTRYRLPCPHPYAVEVLTHAQLIRQRFGGLFWRS